MFLGLDINADSLFRPLCVGPIKVVLLVNFTVHVLPVPRGMVVRGIYRLLYLKTHPPLKSVT